MAAKSNVELAGPWASEETVCDYLDLTRDEVEAMVSRGEILGCAFDDGNLYFPTRQFHNRQVLPGFHDVLHVLATNIDSAKVWSTWMAAAPFGTPAWEQSRTGHLEDVLIEARQDAGLWNL